MVLRSFLIACVMTAALAPLVRRALLNHHLVDLPNQRSSHSAPTPRGGGIAVGLASVIALIGAPVGATSFAVAGSASLLGIVGWIDDTRNLRPLTRLAAQALVPALVLPLLLRGMRVDQWWTWVFGAAVVAWFATYVNAFNFMDGINGMAVAQTVVAGVGIAVMGVRWSSTTLPILGVTIAGAAVGFAPFNAPIARLFLGDVGSYFIGCWLAAAVVIAIRAGIPPEVVIAPFLIYLFDTGLTLLKRWRRGETLFSAHREHAYQRLTQQGWAHTTVSLLAGAAMAMCTAILVIAGKAAPGARTVATVLALAIAASFVLLPTLAHRTRAEAGE